ncbi:hypothetical protein TNCV_2708401 [Trichonephila clavipes]|nr:hypothetical protein TNCV_2708401 [Trichonephila clavipes]
MLPLEQFGPVEQSSNLASHFHILVFQSHHFVDKFRTKTNPASTFAQLYIYVAGATDEMGSLCYYRLYRQRNKICRHEIKDKYIHNSYTTFHHQDDDENKLLV